MQSVPITLTGEEALVLFELLSRWTADRDRSIPAPETFETPAEPIALNALLGHLETSLVAPFASNYGDC